MGNYIIKTMSGDIMKITQQDFYNLANKTGIVMIKSLSEAINVSRIERILPEEKYNLELKEKESNEGVLHDGELVYKKFGQWYLKGSDNVVIDPEYYPEVARNIIPSIKEFENIKHLSKEERLKYILGTTENNKRLNSGLKKIQSYPQEGFTK